MDLRSLSSEQIENLVNEVVRRVVGRVESAPAVTAASPKAGAESQSTSSPEPDKVGAGVAEVCSATAETCTSCGLCATQRTDAVREIINSGACRIGSRPGAQVACHDIAPHIDHTLLRANATEAEITKLCKDAIAHGFAAVCINPAYVPLAAGMLKGTPVKVCTVIGFPLGSMTSEAKGFETRDAAAHGADEIDMVINIGKLKSGDYQYVLDDIRAVIAAAQGRTVKVIIEAASLTDEEKMTACILAKAAGADYVKTSTGFGPGGATVADVALMRRVVGPQMGIKAAGGIRTCEDARALLAAGATRIGTSASIAIVKENAEPSLHDLTPATPGA
jgi:deoxyribose-phosphate aldolase